MATFGRPVCQGRASDKPRSQRRPVSYLTRSAETGRGVANAPSTILSLGRRRITRAALRRRRLPADVACRRGDDERPSAAHSHTLRAEMARSHRVRYQRSNSTSQSRCNLRARKASAADNRRCFGQCTRNTGADGNIRSHSDASNGTEEAGSSRAASAKNGQPTCCAATVQGRSPVAICLVQRTHVVVIRCAAKTDLADGQV